MRCISYFYLCIFNFNTYQQSKMDKEKQPGIHTRACDFKPLKTKVLIIRMSSIGDIVLCSPVVRCLKNIPGKETEIHFLTKKKFATVVEHNPHIQKTYTFEKSIREIRKNLQSEQYDFVIDLHNNLRSRRITFYLGKPFQRFKKLNLQKWILTSFKINKMPDIHIVDRYMEAAGVLGVKNDGKGLDFHIPDQEKVKTNELPEPFRNGFAGFVIGGTYATKRLTTDKIISICNQIQYPVILLGGPEDSNTGDEIARQTSNEVWNSCGKLSLLQSASLVEKSKVVISHDTGLMHIAAALKKPTASVWGNTVPELGMYPYMPAALQHRSRIFQVDGLQCRPCSKLGYKKCPKGHFKCMKEISTDSIAEWVNEQGK